MNKDIIKNIACYFQAAEGIGQTLAKPKYVAEVMSIEKNKLEGLIMNLVDKDYLGLHNRKYFGPTKKLKDNYYK